MIYVAPPDQHLLIEAGHMHISRGPKENRTRSAINPLFRSAAVAYGPRVAGVILTGLLEDGVSGLWEVGSYCWFVARGVPVRDAEDRVTQWLGSSTDVHAMERTESALRRSNEELRRIAYPAAHDLQEPLRNVSNAVGLLKRFYLEQLGGARQQNGSMARSSLPSACTADLDGFLSFGEILCKWDQKQACHPPV